MLSFSKASAATFALILLAACVSDPGVDGPFGVGSGSTPRTHDSEDIAYLCYSETNWQVCVTSAQGHEARLLTTSPGDKTRVSWFPDGRSLLVGTQMGTVVRIDVDTGSEQPIPIELPGVQDPILSRDGTRIAFTFNSGDSRDAGDIYVSSVDGGDVRAVANLPGLQHLPAWGPRDETIYFSSGEPHSGLQDIWQASADGGDVAPVLFGMHFNIEVSVSEAGDLVLSSNRSGRYDLWLDRSGARGERLVAADERIATPTWSPDGSEILFANSHDGKFDLWRVPAAGGEPMRVTRSERGARGPAWRAGRPESAQP